MVTSPLCGLGIYPTLATSTTVNNFLLLYIQLLSTKCGRSLDLIEHNNNWCELLRHYTLLDLHNCFCYVVGNFFSTVHAIIGYFEVTWHLMKLFPAKISEQATMQNPWHQRATVQCYLWMLTVWEIYFHTFVLKKVFFFLHGLWSLGKQLSLFPLHLGKQN